MKEYSFTFHTNEFIAIYEIVEDPDGDQELRSTRDVFQTKCIAVVGFDDYPKERMPNKARISKSDIYTQRGLVKEFFRRFIEG